jgi:hypothetical protein
MFQNVDHVGRGDRLVHELLSRDVAAGAAQPARLAAIEGIDSLPRRGCTAAVKHCSARAAPLSHKYAWA